MRSRPSSAPRLRQRLPPPPTRAHRVSEPMPLGSPDSSSLHDSFVTSQGGADPRTIVEAIAETRPQHAEATDLRKVLFSRARFGVSAVPLTPNRTSSRSPEADERMRSCGKRNSHEAGVLTGNLVDRHVPCV